MYHIDNDKENKSYVLVIFVSTHFFRAIFYSRIYHNFFINFLHILHGQIFGGSLFIFIFENI